MTTIQRIDRKNLDEVVKCNYKTRLIVFVKLSADNGISIKKGMIQKDEVQEKPSSNTCIP